jgi:hypothetical protein
VRIGVADCEADARGAAGADAEASTCPQRSVLLNRNSDHMDSPEVAEIHQDVGENSLGVSGPGEGPDTPYGDDTAKKLRLLESSESIRSSRVI